MAAKTGRQLFLVSKSLKDDDYRESAVSLAQLGTHEEAAILCTTNNYRALLDVALLFQYFFAKLALMHP